MSSRFLTALTALVLGGSVLAACAEQEASDPIPEGTALEPKEEPFRAGGLNQPGGSEAAGAASAPPGSDAAARMDTAARADTLAGADSIVR